MAFFLKKATLKNRTYLSIVESFYSHKKKGTAHKTYKSLGSVETLMENGMDDPIAFYQKEVDKLNEDRKKQVDILKISELSPVRYLGYFPIKAIMNRLNIVKYIDLYKLSTDFNFDLYTMFSSLVYSRVVNPCSKYRTFHEVMPYLFEERDYSYDQLLEGLEFFGINYERFIELFTNQVNEKYKLNTNTTYFDCTNFYFEIDKEDDLRRKGPSKENRKDPIVGLGLLLDANQIPIGMKIFPGNQNEKPILREIINNLKNKNNIKGRTIHVADKGLNCSENITSSLLNKDGYLFSKSVKQLPETEKAWVLLNKDYKEVKDEDGKVKYRYKSCIDEFPYTITDINGKKKEVLIKEKRLVTYNYDLAKKKNYEINKMIEKAHKLCLSKAKKSEYGEVSKYVNFSSIDENGELKKASVFINEKAIEKDKQLAGYNMLVTSEINMKDEEIYNTYHNLWVIEESFKIMKSDLDARPVFVQKEDCIKGHFLICYIAVLLTRIFQVHILKNEYSSSSIIKFMKGFKLVKGEHKYTNITSSNKLIKHLADKYNLSIDNYFISSTQLKKVLNFKF